MDTQTSSDICFSKITQLKLKSNNFSCTRANNIWALSVPLYITALWENPGPSIPLREVSPVYCVIKSITIKIVEKILFEGDSPINQENLSLGSLKINIRLYEVFVDV